MERREKGPNLIQKRKRKKGKGPSFAKKKGGGALPPFRRGFAIGEGKKKKNGNRCSREKRKGKDRGLSR